MVEYDGFFVFGWLVVFSFFIRYGRFFKGYDIILIFSNIVDFVGIFLLW